MYHLSLSNHRIPNPRYVVALPSLAPSFSFAPSISSSRSGPLTPRLCSTLGCRYWRDSSTQNGRPYRRHSGTVCPRLLDISFQARVLCGGAYRWWSGDVTLISWGLGIRNFIVGVTVRIASEEVNLRRERAYLNKLNLALVQVCDREFFRCPISKRYL